MKVLFRSIFVVTVKKEHPKSQEFLDGHRLLSPSARDCRENSTSSLKYLRPPKEESRAERAVGFLFKKRSCNNPPPTRLLQKS